MKGNFFVDIIFIDTINIYTLRSLVIIYGVISITVITI